ncbi:MAG: AraC family transcriptional regulator [Pseudomonadota bacterium]
MDPLDDIFAAMRVQSALYARLEARAPWGLHLNGGASARFGLVVRGSCLLEVEGIDDPVPLAAGDCFVLAHGSSHVVRDHPLTPTVSCVSVVRPYVGGTVELGGSGTPATLVCGWFMYDREVAAPLLDLLPTLLHVRMDQARAQALQGTLQLLAIETAEPDMGSGLVVSRLADILFVQTLRAHVASAGGDKAGWLGALADARIGPALRAIHKDMSRPWTVDALASVALMSRSAFAQRFRQRVGQSPLEYLTRWRMFKAAHLLREERLSLGQVAAKVGYESEAAFSKAFKRERGTGPGAWRRGTAPILVPAPARPIHAS